LNGLRMLGILTLTAIRYKQPLSPHLIRHEEILLFDALERFEKFSLKGNQMKLKFVWKQLFILFILCFIIPSTQAQVEHTIYLCIVDGNVKNLIQVSATEPVGFMFARIVNVYVYSENINTVVADIINVTSDTASGTYRRTGDVLRGAYTTDPTSIPEQWNLGQSNPQPDVPPITTCEEEYADELNGLDRTVLLPISPNQAMAVHRVNTPIQYDNPEQTLIMGAVGFFFQEATIARYPHFQILRFSGGSDDKVSISLPDLETNTGIYLVSRSRLSQNMIDPDGFPNHDPQFLRPIDGFIAQLIRREESFLDTVMGPGNFRIYAEYGTEIFYEPGSLINIERPSTFSPREFEGTSVHVLDCNVDIPYVRLVSAGEAYSHYWYLDEAARNNQSVGRMRSDDFVVTEVQDDGVLLIQTSGGEFAVPAWLVTSGEPLNCEQ
jgi:hypothetical protein